MKTSTFTCDHCGQSFPMEQLLLCRDDRLCPHCAEELTTTCDSCGTRIYVDDARGDDVCTLCQSCFEDYYVTCGRCGRLIRADFACYADDDEDQCDPLCDECAYIRNQESAVHAYDYRPEPIFYGSGRR